MSILTPAGRRWLGAWAVLLAGCLDAPDLADDAGGDAAPGDARPDGDARPGDADPADDGRHTAPPDAGTSDGGGLDGAGPDAGLASCRPLADPEPATPPQLVERTACPAGDAVGIRAGSGARVEARILALDGALVAELWWPGPDGLRRVDRQPVEDEATLAWGAPVAGVVVRVIGDGRYRLATLAEARPTAPVRVEGRIAGWARAVTDEGLEAPAPTSTAGARVDLLGADDLLLAAGRVAADGRFSIEAEAPAEPVTVRLVAETHAGGIPIRVGPEGGAPWSEPVAVVEGSAEIDASLDPEGAAAAAWFIARTAAEGLERLSPLLPPEPAASAAPAVQYHWRPGFSDPCGSCFRPGAEPTIALGGRISDPDEWDRSVILHELGHYIAATFSRDDSGGGPHDGSPIAPAVAWSEGFATFYGSWPDTPVQLDYKLTGVARLDVEAMPAPGAFGTADGTAEGLISEQLVAAVLWDLFDDPADDDDTVSLGEGVFTPLFEGLRGPWVDRGAPGIDLIDYLDALWCVEPAPGIAAVLAERAVPHAPSCRPKGGGLLRARALADGGIALTARVAGRLQLDDGRARSLSVRAGETVRWTPAPAAAVVGATLMHAGGRAVVPLRWPTPILRPMRRRAGAWEQAPLSGSRTP